MGFLSMRELLETIGGSLRPTETTSSWLYRIAEATGLHYRTVRGIWHGETPSRNSELKLRQAAEKIENENRNTAARIEQIAQRLQAIDPEFHREHMDTLRNLATQHRNRNQRGK